MLAHRDAVKAFFETLLPDAVFSSYSVKNKPNRYAVVFVARSQKPAPRFASGQVADIFTFTVHSVGRSEDEALRVQEKVDTLTGKKLTVAGRNLRPAQFITSQAVQLDSDGPRPLWWAVSQFDIYSDPA